MIDPFGRSITYLRVSVTDRCDLRCVYCMAEDMSFLPKRDLLTLEELDRICAAFIRLGTNKIRITGGEPLVRRDVMTLFRSLGARLGEGGLQELVVTTNGTQLAKLAGGLHEAGVRRINVSLDTLDPDKFASITRWGKMGATLDGIFAAKAAGMAIKINAVAMKGVNEDEFDGMLAWCGDHGFDLCLIETMPMGDITGDRTEQYLPLSIVRSRLRRRWTLEDTDYRTGGPGTVFQRGGDRPADRFHHADDPQLLRELQPGAAYLHRHAVHVPRAGRRCRPAEGAARRRDRCPAGRRHPRGNQPQAQGARFHHRSPSRPPGGSAPHERHGRLVYLRRTARRNHTAYGIRYSWVIGRKASAVARYKQHRVHLRGSPYDCVW